MSDITELRQKYPVFSYDSYSWKIEMGNFHAAWNFVSGDRQFHPTIDIQLDKQVSLLDKSAIDTLVFSLGLAEIFSYWKATLSPTIIIKAGNLSQEQLTWWDKLNRNGMGQFFYENQIEDFVGSYHWESNSSKNHPSFDSHGSENTNLIMLGGGKDSAVSAQLLQERNITLTGFALNPTQAVSRLTQVLPFKHLISATRVIDPALLQLNHQGSPNGHVPFSAYLAFLATLVAYLHGFTSIIVSNEGSAEEENITYLGHKINHQYSKTLEFEHDFQTYLTRYLTSGISYFSLLRPLYELQIAGIFSRYPQFFAGFRSCNIAQKTDSWCGHCPKCLSVYLLLSPFLSAVELHTIFGHDLLASPDLLPIFCDMVEEGRTRPFECISTREETIVAANLTLPKYSTPLPVLLEYFRDHILPQRLSDLRDLTAKTLTHFGPHVMPREFVEIIRQALPITLQ
ncbi:MAG: hypothetical protein UX21_C0023G0006 [Microgenomates group bacterium GW2011_GWC2_45_8]|nr:MAG: hypothetical protein UX21_C0023G0006 [Microgenomates group bacterium GW2011_GWC2_45_8]